ncbi:Pentatricopeptide repeat-containing protein, mitochondrial [Glycine soja]
MSFARKLFEGLRVKDVVSWNSLISGYEKCGDAFLVLELFGRMVVVGAVPDEVTVTSVLGACNQISALRLGASVQSYVVKRGYGVNVAVGTRLQRGARATHYSCLVDLLGRAGYLAEAYGVIENMKLKPNEDVWTALLSACRLHRNVKLAVISAQKLFELNPDGRWWKDVENVRALVTKRRLRKPPSYSFVELNKMVHQFFVGDTSHEQSDDIYAKLKDLNEQLKKAGYKPDTSLVLYDVEEEIKEKMLWDHSERLALAFALINTGPGTTIRITKNLCVCGDCHTMCFTVHPNSHGQEIK